MKEKNIYFKIADALIVVAVYLLSLIIVLKFLK
jgi:hypothetical protein